MEIYNPNLFFSRVINWSKEVLKIKKYKSETLKKQTWCNKPLIIATSYRRVNQKSKIGNLCSEIKIQYCF